MPDHLVLPWERQNGAAKFFWCDKKIMTNPAETSCYEVHDSDFEQCFIPHARLERLWTGARWCEGPAWFAAGRYLVWSDIPNDRMLRWDECSGAVSAFRLPARNSNGNTVDNYGRLVTCEHLSRSVTRTEFDGSISTIVNSFEGKRLNSPNDVVVKSDGSVWFTDPDYGILTDYEGVASEAELDTCSVYRVDVDGSVSRVIDCMLKPNGLAFSPDESYLYVSDTGASHVPAGPRHIRRFELDEAGRSVVSDTILCECDSGLFDGFRLDTQHRLWCSAGDGVHCFDRSGRLIGKILVPEGVSNVTFGGPRGNRLFITATTSLYSVFLAVNGVKPG